MLVATPARLCVCFKNLLNYENIYFLLFNLWSALEHEQIDLIFAEEKKGIVTESIPLNGAQILSIFIIT
jgi:hypothetical protein